MSAKNHANESTSFNDDNIAFHTQINECNILCPNNNAVRGWQKYAAPGRLLRLFAQPP